ncbi:hypothetical protein DEU56DRAFT_956409 [Suillus clintonianus]|uniref:uncharacterized protein n=1 Tax=Suillus clintonianus TaxID=1904413 RepID=UPI001B86367D|nr:uncharacterized protein DEU56DRAFT_956409 [Suillus clintonianus]KAG2129807.1 hypothetical protein DEU56DRAFT_956409 [Suillus clintonianus]
MPAIRRGSTYLDVSTTAHTPEGRLKLDKLHAGRNLAYQNAVCTALLFICDENRDLDPADTLSVSFNAFQTTMRGRASAADMKMGSGKHPHLRRLLSFFWEHGQIDLTFAHNGRQRNVVQEIDIQPSFREMQSSLSPREKFRAYMSLATNWLQAVSDPFQIPFGKDRTPTVLERVKTTRTTPSYMFCLRSFCSLAPYNTLGGGFSAWSIIDLKILVIWNALYIWKAPAVVLKG